MKVNRILILNGFMTTITDFPFKLMRFLVNKSVGIKMAIILEY